MLCNGFFWTCEFEKEIPGSLGFYNRRQHPIAGVIRSRSEWPAAVVKGPPHVYQMDWQTRNLLVLNLHSLFRILGRSELSFPTINVCRHAAAGAHDRQSSWLASSFSRRQGKFVIQNATTRLDLLPTARQGEFQATSGKFYCLQLLCSVSRGLFSPAVRKGERAEYQNQEEQIAEC